MTLGEERVYSPEAKDLVIITFGNGVTMSLRAAREIEKMHGWKVRIVDLRWLVPLNVASRGMRATRILVSTKDASRPASAWRHHRVEAGHGAKRCVASSCRYHPTSGRRAARPAGRCRHRRRCEELPKLRSTLLLLSRGSWSARSLTPTAFLLPLKGGGREGDGFARRSPSLLTSNTIPPNPPLEGEGFPARRASRRLRASTDRSVPATSGPCRFVRSCCRNWP